MDTSYIDNLISALRAETEKNSISPERVGYILQHAIDLLSQHAGDQLAHIPDNKTLALKSLTTDYLTVLKGVTVAELVIQEYKSVGGVLVLSACDGEVDYVNWDSESDNGNQVYIVTTKDWERKPQFVAGDIVRCSRWDSSTNELVNYIGSVWMKSDDILYIEILNGNGIPQVGDNLVQFGHAYNPDRQGFIILSTEQGIPNISVYDGVTDGNISQYKLTARLGDLTGLTNANGNALSGYGLWTNSLYLGSKATEIFNGIVDAVVGSRFEVTNNAIESEVAARLEGDNTLSSQIAQTASNISLKVKELGIANLNHAYGTATSLVVKELKNIDNQILNLYDVTGLNAGEKISASVCIRIKDITFGASSRIAFQLDNNFGYCGLDLRFTARDFEGITPDENGYLTVRKNSEGLTIPNYVYNTQTPITADIKGKVVMRLDYISGSEIEIRELKVEKGEECTAWTARTQDMDTALIATGIDIEKGLIKATADNFKVYNDRGVVTMEVDSAGNLTANAVLVRNVDPETKDATPYLARINLNTGFFEQFYPLKKNNGNDNISFQMGWDEMSQSLFRFYKKDGSMAWKAGAEAYLIDTTKSTETVISPVDLYKCSSATEADARNEIKTMLSLATTRLYKKTVQSNGSVSVTYYSDASCSIPASGFYTDGGLPEMAFSELGESSTVCRRLYTITDGSMGLAQFVSWDIHDGFDDNINKV